MHVLGEATRQNSKWRLACELCNVYFTKNVFSDMKRFPLNIKNLTGWMELINYPLRQVLIEQSFWSHPWWKSTIFLYEFISLEFWKYGKYFIPQANSLYFFVHIFVILVIKSFDTFIMSIKQKFKQWFHGKFDHIEIQFDEFSVNQRLSSIIGSISQFFSWYQIIFYMKGSNWRNFSWNHLSKLKIVKVRCCIVIPFPLISDHISVDTLLFVSDAIL